MSYTDSNGYQCSDTALTLTWQRVAENSKFPPRDGHCACVSASKVYAFGGVVQSSKDGEHDETNDLLVFDTETSVWEKVNGQGSVPLPRVSATMSAVDDKLYLFGGLSNSVGWLGDIYVFDTNTRVWTKPQVTGVSPSPRDKLASAVCNNKIYFFGGFGPKLSHSNDDDDDDDVSDEDEDDVRTVRSQQKAAQFGWFDDLFVFDTVTSSWSQPMHMNSCTVTPRAAHSMCSVGEQLVIFGGRDCDSRTNDLHFYDTVNRKWAAGPVTPRPVEPRSFHAACAVGSNVLIFGGRGTQDQHFNDCRVFNFESKRWQQSTLVGDTVPSPRGSHILVAVGNSVVLYGGSSDFNRNVGHCTKYYNDTFILTTGSSYFSTIIDH